MTAAPLTMGRHSTSQYERYARLAAAESGIQGDLTQNAEALREYVQEQARALRANGGRLSAAQQRNINGFERWYHSLQEAGAEQSTLRQSDALRLPEIPDPRLSELPREPPASGGFWTDGRSKRYAADPEGPERRRAGIEQMRTRMEDDRQSRQQASIEVNLARMRAGQRVDPQFVREVALAGMNHPEAKPAFVEALREQRGDPAEEFARTEPSARYAMSSREYREVLESFDRGRPSPIGRTEDFLRTHYYGASTADQQRAMAAVSTDPGASPQRQAARAGLLLLAERYKEQQNETALRALSREISWASPLLASAEQQDVFASQREHLQGAGPRERARRRFEEGRAASVRSLYERYAEQRPQDAHLLLDLAERDGSLGMAELQKLRSALPQRSTQAELQEAAAQEPDPFAPTPAPEDLNKARAWAVHLQNFIVRTRREHGGETEELYQAAARQLAQRQLPATEVARLQQAAQSLGLDELDAVLGMLDDTQRMQGR